MPGSSRLGVEQIWAILAWFRRSPVGRRVSQGLAIALIALLALRLWQLWSSTNLDLSGVRPVIAVAAVLASTVAVVSYGCVWLVVLSRLGNAVHPRHLTLFLKSQLGKYIPGSVWQYAGRVGLGTGDEIPASTGVASIAVEVAASLVASLLIGLVALPLWLAAVAAGLAFLATIAIRIRGTVMRAIGSRIAQPLVRVALRTTVRVVPLYGVVWLTYGIAFWLTARSVFDVPVSDMRLYVGVFALAWAVGFVAVFAPGGVGVREAVIVALLAGHLGEARAIVVAGASRIVLTAIDLVLGGASIAAGRWRVPRAERVEVRR